MIENNSIKIFSLHPYTGKPHFGSSSGKTLCGKIVDVGTNEPFKVKIESMELMELWNENCAVQDAKWVKVTKYDKCNRCMSALEKHYR